jgi:hypothetical protein
MSASDECLEDMLESLGSSRGRESGGAKRNVTNVP